MALVPQPVCGDVIGEDSTVHVLTKIFIVLVSLLAVLLVPLVVVYATNENSYKSRVVSAEAKAASAAEALKQAEIRQGAELAQAQADIAALRSERDQARAELTASQATIHQLESQVAAATATQAEIMANLSSIKTAVAAAQQLNESLVTEIRTLRTEMVAIERQRVELDEALRDVTSQLEVAQQARRALAEELARVKDEHAKAMTRLSQAYLEGFGSRTDVRAGIIPDKNLSATIIRVERSSNQVLAEIDAGSADGVKKDWVMPISNGGTFIGNLRIINVDVKRATGIVSLESKDRGLVQVGHMVHAKAGQN